MREERGSREVELRVVVSVCACPAEVALDEGGDDDVEVGGGVCEEGVFTGYEVAVWNSSAQVLIVTLSGRGK